MTSSPGAKSCSRGSGGRLKMGPSSVSVFPTTLADIVCSMYWGSRSVWMYRTGAVMSCRGMSAKMIGSSGSHAKTLSCCLVGRDLSMRNGWNGMTIQSGVSQMSCAKVL